MRARTSLSLLLYNVFFFLIYHQDQTNDIPIIMDQIERVPPLPHKTEHRTKPEILLEFYYLRVSYITANLY